MLAIEPGDRIGDFRAASFDPRWSSRLRWHAVQVESSIASNDASRPAVVAVTFGACRGVTLRSILVVGWPGMAGFAFRVA